MDGVYWCMQFVWWCFQQADKTLFMDGGKTASCGELMRWAQAIIFCGVLIYAAVDDLKTRTVSNIACIVMALAGLITISPASLSGALLAMLPFYLCAGFGLMGGGDWRLAAAIGFVLGVGRVLTGFLFMAVALLLASLVMRAFPALRQSAAKKQPLVPYFAVAFIPAYFL